MPKNSASLHWHLQYLHLMTPAKILTVYFLDCHSLNHSVMAAVEVFLQVLAVQRNTLSSLLPRFLFLQSLNRPTNQTHKFPD